mmetsp:Transcript_123796/g.355488  ORF Transcript_123796/g.355488 Transcript_123796/m.355488 type:complete len:215 (+) Transcript_123796:150-794(+)
MPSQISRASASAFTRATSTAAPAIFSTSSLIASNAAPCRCSRVSMPNTFASNVKCDSDKEHISFRSSTMLTRASALAAAEPTPPASSAPPPHAPALLLLLLPAQLAPALASASGAALHMRCLPLSLATHMSGPAVVAKEVVADVRDIRSSCSSKSRRRATPRSCWSYKLKIASESACTVRKARRSMEASPAHAAAVSTMASASPGDDARCSGAA